MGERPRALKNSRVGRVHASRETILISHIQACSVQQKPGRPLPQGGAPCARGQRPKHSGPTRQPRPATRPNHGPSRTAQASQPVRNNTRPARCGAPPVLPSPPLPGGPQVSWRAAATRRARASGKGREGIAPLKARAAGSRSGGRGIQLGAPSVGGASIPRHAGGAAGDSGTALATRGRAQWTKVKWF